MLIPFPPVGDTLGVMDAITTVSRSIARAMKDRMEEGRGRDVFWDCDF